MRPCRVVLALLLLLLDIWPRVPTAAGLVATYTVLLVFEVRELVRIGGSAPAPSAVADAATPAASTSDPKGAPTR